MRSQIKCFLTFIASCIPFLAYATTVQTFDTANIHDVFDKAELEKNSFEAEQVLIVFDIDNTLLQPAEGHDIGTTQWWDWQNNLLNDCNTTGSCSRYMITSNFNTLIDINNLLIPLMQLKPVDDIVVSDIKTEQAENFKTIALSSRDTRLFPASRAQLNQNKINFSSLWSANLEKSEIFKPKNFTRPALYTDGIIMTTGQNKGEALQYLISEFKENSPQIIIFVDDTQKNIDDVNAAFNNSSSTPVEVFTYHYTKDQNRVNRFNNSHYEQEIANKQWHQIKHVFNIQADK